MDLDHEFTTWTEWIRAYGPIHSEVYRIGFRQQMWDRFAEVVDANPGVVKSGLFLEWVRNDFARSQAIATRSQVDLSSDVASLGKLLDRMTRFPGAFSKDRYLRDRAGSEDLAEQDWLDIARPGCDYLNATVPSADLEKLRAAVEPVRGWVNRSVAHVNRERPFHEIPPLTEIRTVAGLVMRLFRRWHSHILNLDTQGEVWMGAWESIFRTPWEIPEEETDVFGIPKVRRRPW